MRKKSGFTLIELLVVIAIIAILASLMLGSFFGMFETAKKTSCMNSLAQMGKAIQAYTQDNEDLLPRTVDAVPKPNGDFERGTTWANAIAPYMGLKEERSGKPFVTNEQISKSKVMTCPTKFKLHKGQLRDDNHLTYGKNVELFPYDPAKVAKWNGFDPAEAYPEQSFRVSLFEITTKTMMLADGEFRSRRYRFELDVRSVEGGNENTFEHKPKGFNMLYIDGRAQYRQVDDVPTDKESDEFVKKQDYTGRQFWQGFLVDTTAP